MNISLLGKTEGGKKIIFWREQGGGVQSETNPKCT